MAGGRADVLSPKRKKRRKQQDASTPGGTAEALGGANAFTSNAHKPKQSPKLAAKAAANASRTQLHAAPATSPAVLPFRAPASSPGSPPQKAVANTPRTDEAANGAAMLNQHQSSDAADADKGNHLYRIRLLTPATAD